VNAAVIGVTARGSERRLKRIAGWEVSRREGVVVGSDVVRGSGAPVDAAAPIVVDPLDHSTGRARQRDGNGVGREGRRGLGLGAEYDADTVRRLHAAAGWIGTGAVA